MTGSQPVLLNPLTFSSLKMTISLVSATRIKVSDNVDVSSDIGQLIQSAAAKQVEYKRLEQELKDFRKTLTNYIQDKELDQVTCGDFLISKVTRANWTYSNKLSLEMQRIEIDKKWEQKNGDASNAPSVSCSLKTVTKR